jgi:regulator of sigma E protease
MFIFQDIARELDKSRNSLITLDFIRHGNPMNVEINLNEDGKLGVGLLPLSNYFTVEYFEYSFFQAIPAGIRMGWETLANYVKQFRLVFTKEGAKNLGGFGAIGKIFPKKWDWTSFWLSTALISIILAFMNILPIPALDGGHVMFVLYEMITGRKPNQKFMEYAQTVGFFILIALVLFANGNDIVRLFR